MKLNRTHALLLVGTLAAGACVTESSDDDSTGGQSGSGGKGGKGGTAGSATGGKAGHATGGVGATSGAGGKGGNAGANEAGSVSEGGMAGSVVEGGGEGGIVAEGGATSTSGAGGEGGAAVCDDTLATQLTCDDLNTTSCGIKDFLDAECAMTWKNMKPSISNVARNCMLELTQSELCDDATNTYHCVDHALQLACADATAAAPCEQILAYSSCSGKTEVTAETCQTYLSGLTANGRSQMVSCMENFCDLYTCAEGLQ